MSNMKPAGYLNKFTGMIWNPEQQPGAESEPEIYEPLVRLSDVHGLVAERDALVAENAELKSRTVTVPKKAYLRDMRCNVVRWSQVINALSDAGVAFARDDGELIAGTRETPATDAAIAEIGAKAIENAINAQSGKPFITDKTNGLAYINLGDIQDFAANLRAGRKG